MSWAEEQWWFGLEDWIIEHDPSILIEQNIWVTKDGNQLYITNMATSHIRNCIKMIEDGRLYRHYALPYLYNELKKRNE